MVKSRAKTVKIREGDSAEKFCEIVGKRTPTVQKYPIYLLQIGIKSTKLGISKVGRDDDPRSGRLGPEVSSSLRRSAWPNLRKDRVVIRSSM